MTDSPTQPLRVKIDLSYEATLYEGDPSDAFEIADLEKEDMEEVVKNYLESIVGPVKNFNLRVQPE